MAKKINSLLIWLMIGLLSLAGLMGSNLPKVKAAEADSSIQLGNSIVNNHENDDWDHDRDHDWDHDRDIKVSFKKDQDSGWENNRFANIEVKLNEKSRHDVKIDYEVTGGTATEDEDYKIYGNTVTIKEGELSSDIHINIVDDKTVESDETIVFNLTSATNAKITEPSEFTYTILDNDKLLNTEVITSPLNPDGQNGWFVTNPTIDFTVEGRATTYYKWNDECHFKEYRNHSLLAKEGVNVLYYYSKDRYGNKEEVKSLEIKVDTLAPISPITVSATANNNGEVEITWNEVTDATHYEIWRDGVYLATSDNALYLDTSVSENTTYMYKVVAVDEAGNKSPFSNEVSITTPKTEKPVVTPVITEQPKVETVLVVTPAIASGVSTYQAPQVTQEPKVEEVKPAVEGASTENNDNEDEDQNWNRLLLAISILIIAAGAAVGGYYGYQWFLARREEEDEDKKGPKSKSRW